MIRIILRRKYYYYYYYYHYNCVLVLLVNLLTMAIGFEYNERERNELQFAVFYKEYSDPISSSLDLTYLISCAN